MEIPPGLDVAFLSAARGGDIPGLKWITKLFENGEGPGMVPFAALTTPGGHNALHWAAREGETSTCRFLTLKLKFNINETDEDGETPLFKAVMGKHRPTTIFLLGSGADVTKCNNFGDTPLHYAALRGSKEIVERLISKGAHVCSTSQRGTPLHFAARAGNHDVLKYLLDLDADVHPNISSLELSPLVSSIFAKSIECVELLLKAGVDPNHQCYQATPLHYAVTVPDEGLVRCLLKAGANPNLLDSVGYTALDHAALLGHHEIVELLFPFTSRIACYPDWSINGVMHHAESNEAKALFKSKQKEVFLLGKSKGREAFQSEKYCDAYNWYKQAAKVDPTDAKVQSNMSFCCIKLNDGQSALKYARTCIRLEPSWAKAHYREGEAWKLHKDFKEAAASFSRALALDPRNEEIKEACSVVQAEVNKFRHWYE